MINKKSFFGKIVLLLLFLIGSPFILGFFLFFIVLYIVISPFERIVYKRSYYYKDLDEKYYLFVSFHKSFKKYNDLRKGIENEIIIEDIRIKAFISKEEKLVYYWFNTIKYENNTWIIDNNKKLDMYITNNVYLVINQTLFDKEDIKIARLNPNMILYCK